MENMEESLAVLEELIEFLETQPVFDKLADGGCGYVDPHRSDVFEDILKRARESLEELKKLVVK
ncbi:hypothetical protein [Thermodesulforhabdus norvegica]|uniref:HEPN domain-containing protein n=1 Tax=Thermodesulforhabdus norvegica TaxID=39841 RepID=A0A1I4SYC8_9BACT|nr:hypothetical protein [Thermodesulforhabdus norvegica]SFM69310.1 hypothetical protein SAMN05660836_01226 [Thermodesulforhabdus norvegica]